MAAEGGAGGQRQFQGERGQGQGLTLGITPGVRGSRPRAGAWGPLPWLWGVWGC